MAQHRGVWDDDTVAKLKKLASEGYSASQIGLRLGGLTRNQVLGKCDRLGVKIFGNVRHRTAERVRTAKLMHEKRRAAAGKQPAKLVVEPLPLRSAGDVARKQLADLTEQDCKYPVGHPGEKGFGFCAAERVQGLPYCAQHAARCLTPYERRKSLHQRDKDTSSDVIRSQTGRVLDVSELASVSK